MITLIVVLLIIIIILLLLILTKLSVMSTEVATNARDNHTDTWLTLLSIKQLVESIKKKL